MNLWKGKRVLVTGGAGFIGSHLVEELIKQGADVLVLDNESTGTEANLIDAYEKAKGKGGFLQYKKLDLLDESILLSNVFQGIEYVFHLAAMGSVPKSVANPIASLNNNVMATARVLEACKIAKVKRVIFSSSSSVYGDNPDLKKVEEKTGKCLSPYALSKSTCENLMRLYYELYGLETVNLRYFNVFGPRQNPNGDYAAVIPLFIKKMLSQDRPFVFGDGIQSRDFTYVKNVIEGTMLFAILSKEGVCGKSFNIARGERYTVNQLIDKLNELLKTNLTPIYIQERKGDVKHSSADIQKATALGFEPKISFEEGLRNTIKYYKQKTKTL